MRKSTPLACLGLMVAATVMVGCQTNSADITSLRLNPSPKLKTLQESPSMLKNTTAVVRDENGRMFWADMRRFWLLERPSRLAIEPIPY